jgi:Fe-S cluster assembly protein SufD
VNPEALDRYVAEYARIAPALPGAGYAWLRDARDRALAEFRQSGFPDIREEAWKYTDLAPIARRTFQFAPSDAPGAPRIDPEPYRYAGLRCFEAVFLAGRHLPPASRLSGLPEGLRIESLSERLERGDMALPRLLAAESSRLHGGFVSLNAAFSTDGAVVEIADGIVIDDPIHLLFVGSGGAALAINPRVIVRVGRGSRARIIETYAGPAGAAYFTNAVTRILAADSANVEHYRIQEEATSAYHVGAVMIEQARDSRVASHSIVFGARLSRQNISVDLDAEGAAVELSGLYLVGGRQHVDHHTVIEHRKPSTTSREDYRGVVSGQARAVFNGRVVVHEGALKADAAQSNRNLLLSAGAEVDTKPELEIYADDVKCSHGATVGSLDEQALFYLRARGIPQATARGLLTYAFADDVIERIGIPALRQRLERDMIGLLPESETLALPI